MRRSAANHLHAAVLLGAAVVVAVAAAIAVAGALVPCQGLFPGAGMAYAAPGSDADASLPSAQDLDNTVNTQQLPDSSFIYDTPLEDLAGADAYHDNQTVQVVGEVLGDNLRATASGNKRWISVGSAETPGAYALSVYMSAASAESIDTYGRYGSVGTIIQVRGTFHLACDEHQGATDLHADYVSVVEKGASVREAFHWEVFVPGVVAVLLGFALMGVFRILRERRR